VKQRKRPNKERKHTKRDNDGQTKEKRERERNNWLMHIEGVCVNV